METQNVIVMTGLITLFTFLLYKFSRRNFDYWLKRGIPYIEPVAFVGNLKDVITFKRSIGESVCDMYNQIEGPLFGMWCFNTPFLVIREPAFIKCVLNQDFSSFNNRAAGPEKPVDPISSNMLLLLKNPKWRNVRQKITPALSSSKIKAMMPLLDEVVQDMIEYLNKNLNNIIDAGEVCEKFTTDVITSCFFGLKGNSFIVEKAPFREAGRQMFGRSIINGIRAVTYFLMPNLATLFKIKLVPEATSSFLQSVFWQVVHERERTNMKRNDFIDTLRKLKEETSDGIILDDDMMVSQVVAFFLAGFETSSSTITFALHELSLNKSMQDRLRYEINCFVSKYGGCTYEALADMSYLHKVISETLRKYPVLPFLDRRCTKDYKFPGTDIVIEAGNPVLIPVYGLHHDPKIYHHPERFDPERFSEESFCEIPSGAYIPFGAGPRSCPGERFGIISSKLGLAEILANFEVIKTEETPVPLIFDTTCITLAPLNGLSLRFAKVEQKQ